MAFLNDIQELGKFLDRDDRVSIPKSLPSCDNEFLSSPRSVKLALKLIEAYAARSKDALNLYRPLPAAVDFHSCMRRFRLVSGSNQSAKTFSAIMELARIARGLDPFKKRADKDLKMLALGRDHTSVGQILWKKLHWPGAFEIIQDEETGLWRSTRPDPTNPQCLDPRDLARRKEWAPAPPIIPPSCIDRMAWQSRGENIPAVVQLKNGTEILFRTSNGDPLAGVQLDFVHFDEEIINKDWYDEMIPRLVRHDGIFVWSATPEKHTPQFFNLHRDVLAGDPNVAEFTFLTEDNPYLTPEAKESMRLRLLAAGEEVYAVKWLGKYAIQGREVYPTYDIRDQGFDLDVVPDDWMKIVVIDPGSQVSAFGIFGVDPESKALHVLEECELRNKDAAALAMEVKRLLNGSTPEAYIIDKRAGIQIPMGRNDRTADHYAKEFEKAGLPKAHINPGAFVYGCDIPSARELSVKSMLGNGTLRFRRGHCFKMDQQIRNRFYDKNDPDKRERRTTHDLVDILEYAAAFFDERGIYYRKPKKKQIHLSRYDRAVYESWRKKKKKNRKFR